MTNRKGHMPPCPPIPLKNKCDTFVFVLRSLSHLFDHLGPHVVPKCLTLFSVSSELLCFGFVLHCLGIGVMFGCFMSEGLLASNSLS
ncbi:hypothetical protein PVAP13_5KG360307 [Panicum virgatum]|uniref:Uncharacterized protein n=1 Tax=Panicum virgatum TaxID=38727 RepID=A0A8T0SMN8_PANVG|nr:hypothetical protein PVAP13_5KG360307 [Panicum virgatum]